MTNDQINTAIAEACGWTDIRERTEEHVDLGSRTITHITGVSGYPKGWDNLNYLPDYCNDLNAMHEAEKMITDEDSMTMYYLKLYDATSCASWPIMATARQRSEAFLRTIGKWEEARK